MRENMGLYRGKRKDNGEWETGSLVVIRPDCSDQQTFIADKMTGYHTLVLPETVGQFTGLTDKNGVKIFEGDIVRYEDDIGYVIYNGDDARFLVDSPNMYISMDYSNEFEVIGNIHDNPELLQKI